MRFLSENLCGVDIHPTACLVTCFSLYLAFLDQMEPKEIMELREVLAKNTNKKLLPRIFLGKNRIEQAIAHRRDLGLPSGVSATRPMPIV